MFTIIKTPANTAYRDFGNPRLRISGEGDHSIINRYETLLANILLGNDLERSVLEIPSGFLQGEFNSDVHFVLYGFGAEAQLITKTEDDPHRTEKNKTIYAGSIQSAKGGDQLFLRPTKHSHFCYLAFSRQLEKLSKNEANQKDIPLGFYNQAPPAAIRVIKGPDYHLYSSDYWRFFLYNNWLASSNSDRSGTRLTPAENEYQAAVVEQTPRPSLSAIRSHAVLPGAVQLPNLKEAIVIFGSTQATGGYPQIASIIEADLYHFANIKPGRSIRFQLVTRQAAAKAARTQAASLYRFQRILHSTRNK